MIGTMSGQNILIIKSSGEREEWSRAKLLASLMSSKANAELAEEIAVHVEKDLKDGMHTSDIYEHAAELLRKYDKPLAAHYSLKRAMLELGPSGYPFERFISGILKAEGYQTEVGVIVQGLCVEHEVDVIAEKEGERMLVEAKYHNSPDTKSDVKVALYVHARFEDIKKRTETTDTASELFTRPWLITNTSFTSQAIRYAECAGLALTGWNYPRGHTLQDLVLRTKTHPITVLTTLPKGARSALLEKGVVLCSDILRDTRHLDGIGLRKQEIDGVIKEGTLLCPP